MIGTDLVSERAMKWVLIVLVGLVLAVCVLFATRSYLSRQHPPQLGLENGRLRACPSSPNCVLSEGADEAHAIAPLPYRGDRAQSERALQAALASLPRTSLLRRQGDYWLAQSVSGLFRFVDDVELRFDDAQAQIQVRSASRVGYSDLGANRKRVEALRAAYLAQP